MTDADLRRLRDTVYSLLGTDDPEKVAAWIAEARQSHVGRIVAIIDPRLPPNTVELRANNKVLGRILNLLDS